MSAPATAPDKTTPPRDYAAIVATWPRPTQEQIDRLTVIFGGAS